MYCGSSAWGNGKIGINQADWRRQSLAIYQSILIMPNNDKKAGGTEI